MILVTGGTGLLGSHLLLSLARDGRKVRAIYRNADTLKRVRRVFSTPGRDADDLFDHIEWFPADINDLPTLELAFEGVSLVYHCAALISFDPRDFRRLKKINIEGTAHIVNLCLAKGIKKLLYVSSIAAVGRSQDGRESDEDDFGPDPFPGVYAISKQAAEMEVWRGSQEGLTMVIINPGLIIGPGFWQEGSGAILRAGASGRLFAPPGGTGFVAVTDVVRIMRRLMDSGYRNERFIVISENRRYQEVLNRIAQACGKQGPKLLLPKSLLGILRYLDWLRTLISGHPRMLTKSTVAGLLNPTTYSNRKIREALNYTFEPLEHTLAASCEALANKS